MVTNGASRSSKRFTASATRIRPSQPHPSRASSKPPCCADGDGSRGDGLHSLRTCSELTVSGRGGRRIESTQSRVLIVVAFSTRKPIRGHVLAIRTRRKVGCRPLPGPLSSSRLPDAACPQRESPSSGRTSLRHSSPECRGGW